jgi:hypothetical protein
MLPRGQRSSKKSFLAKKTCFDVPARSTPQCAQAHALASGYRAHDQGVMTFNRPQSAPKFLLACIVSRRPKVTHADGKLCPFSDNDESSVHERNDSIRVR